MGNNNAEYLLDETDYAMVRILQSEGRISNVKLAEKLNMSEAPCWRRLKRLEEIGVIDGYQANVSRRKIGLGVLAFVGIVFADHSTGSPDEFERAVAEIPEILSCHNVSGDEDYILQVVTADLDSYEKLLSGVIRKLPGVTSVKSVFTLKEIKSSGALPV